MNSSTIGIMAIASAGQFVFCNEAMRDMFGFPVPQARLFQAVAKPLRIAGSADLGPIREDLLRKLRLVRFLSMQSLSERMTAQRKHREGGPIRSRSSEDLLSTLRTTGGSQSLVPKCVVCIGAFDGRGCWLGGLPLPRFINCPVKDIGINSRCCWVGYV
mgnify:CR=1 FL=1